MTDGRPGAPGAGTEERIRAADWAATSMGPAESWPASLRIALSICLSSRFPMLVWWGPELTVFYNDAYLPLLGTKHPSALGRPAAEVWAEAWDDLGPLAEQARTGGGATFSQDQRLFLDRHGYLEETYWTFSYSPVPDDDGGIGGIFIAVTDTTSRVLGERRLRALHDLGELSTASVGTLEQACSEVVGLIAEHRAAMPFAQAYLRTPDGTDVQVVASAGMAPGSAVVSGALPGADADAAVRRVAVRGTSEVVGGLREGPPDWYLPGPVGPAVPERAVVLPMTVSGAREPIGVLVVGVNPYRELDADYRSFFDLVAGHVSTAMTDAQAYLAERRRAEALAELDRAKTDFFSNVSHEFRTPLALIAGPVQELRALPALNADPRASEELAVIERNAQRLGKLVNTLLEFSRLQAGRIDARFEPVDLARTTAELASVFRSAVERAGLEFVVDCRPLDQPVHLDRDMWEKVVLNLLSNALKFTFTGSITVRLEGGAAGACLTVSDTGTGVPPEELPRLFERFHRVANARSRSGEGSGIGLAMVRELVSLHGGTIEAESAPGVGTTFTVVLPFGTAHLPADRLAPPSTELPAVSPSVTPFVAEALRWLPRPDVTLADAGSSASAPVGGAGGRVLVADDNADMREYLVRLLAPHYDVAGVGDGQAALEQALADPPDLIVSDVMMPRLDGMQLVAALRRDERTSRVPVVLLSARAGQQAAVQGLAAGADDYLVKPFSAQELLARVGAHLSLGRARRAAEERFTAMADLAPALIWVADPAGRRVFVNRGWSQFTGRDVSEELGQGWADRVHPEDRERYGDAVAAAAGRREGWEVEFRLLRSDGAYHWLLERAVPIGSGESFAGFVGSCTDINARYRETERQMLLAEVGAVLDRETGVEAQLGALARLLVDHRLAEFCGVVLVGDDGQLTVAGVAGPDARTERAIAALDAEAGLARTAVDTGRSVLVNQLPDTHPATRPLEEGGVVGARSGLAVPLRVRGRVLASLGLARRGDAPPFTEDDRALIEEIAARAALAVDNAMLLADERAAARRLALLQGATAELSAATTPVEVAEAAAGHIRQLTGETSRVAVYELDPSHRALVALTISGGKADSQRLWSTLPLTAPLAVTAAVTERRALWIENIADHPPGALAPELMASMQAYGLAANVALPLSVAGRMVGVIGIGFAEVQSFSASERAMLLAVAEQCAQALDRARLYRAEQGIAETLQRSLLPARLPELERLALAARYVPGAEGTQAGGDWYDVVHLEDDRVVIAVGDVVGQGPAAAAVMGQLRSALSAALLQGCGPAEALELLDLFAARLPGALASTAACLVVDAGAGTVRWARAGHPPPLVVTSDGRARFLEGEGSGTVLGVPGRAPYTEGSFTIEPGTTLLLYTDGLAERRGEPLDDGLARVRDVAARHATADPGRLTAWLLGDVLADTDQPDDVAVIAARLLPAPLAERLPADPAKLSVVRRAVARWATACGLDDDLVEDLQLALGEALSNAVEHAYAGGGDGECAYFLARRPDGSVVAQVTDTGAWRPPPADKGYRGRGLELISALAQDVEVVHGPAAPGGAGTCVRFRFPPPDGPPGEPVRRPSRRAVPIGTADDGQEARVVESQDGPAVQLAVEGTLDIATVGPVAAALAGRLQELPRRTAVLLDLSPTGYLASAGVGMVLELRARAAELGLTLRVRTEPGSPPDRILTLAGLADELRAR